MMQPSPTEPTQASAEQANGNLAPDAELHALRAQLTEVQIDRDKYLVLAQRARADFENYQKRVQRDLQVERHYAAQPLIADLLPILDNLERALDSARHQADASGILNGVQLIHKSLLDVLAKHGVEAIRPVAQPFDPNAHQAVTQEVSTTYPPMTVLHTLQAGYRMRERIIRPAQVVVSKGVDA